MSTDPTSLALLPKRVADKIHVTETCWIWTGATKGNGYGHTWFDGRNIPAHRLVYLLIAGDIPTGLQLHHQCENRICCNPAHLSPVTRKEHSAEHGLSGWAAIYAAADVCKNGHPFDGHNSKQRTCSVCHKQRNKEWAERLGEEFKARNREAQRRYLARKGAA